MAFYSMWRVYPFPAALGRLPLKSLWFLRIACLFQPLNGRTWGCAATLHAHGGLTHHLENIFETACWLLCCGCFRPPRRACCLLAAFSACGQVRFLLLPSHACACALKTSSAMLVCFGAPASTNMHAAATTFILACYAFCACPSMFCKTFLLWLPASHHCLSPYFSLPLSLSFCSTRTCMPAFSYHSSSCGTHWTTAFASITTCEHTLDLHHLLNYPSSLHFARDPFYY